MGRYTLCKNPTVSLVQTVTKITRPFLKKSKIWVSGTKVANYLLKDPVIDWLIMYYPKYGFNINIQLRRRSSNNKSFKNQPTSNPLFANGNLFEDTVYKELRSKFGDAFVNLKGCVQDKDFENTKTFMSKETPIIAQAFIKSDAMNLRGVVDLLVRSDYVNKLVNQPIPELEDTSKLFYVVIDIKWSNMELCVDGKTIRNSGRFRANKGQLLIYTTILEEIQNYPFQMAFILSKSWKIDKKMSGYNCFERLGVVDFAGKDREYVEMTSNAINWVRDLTINGQVWSPMYPHIKEMCCNACNVDETWDSVKKKIMTETKDVTQVWMVTPEQRNVVFDKGVRKWDDKRCTTNALGINGVTKNTISNILKVNKSCKETIIMSKEKINWGEITPNDFFIDFETISEEYRVMEKIDIYNGKSSGSLIFMIGVGYICESTGNFVYKNFTSLELSEKGESNIIKLLKNFIIERTSTPRFFHWGHVEQTLLTSALKRHSITWENTSWVDMCKTLVNAHFSVKGSLNFKLKNIATALHRLGYIKTTWDGDDTIKDGMSAMKKSINFYRNNEGDLKDVIKYNEVDCKVLSEIFLFVNRV